MFQAGAKAEKMDAVVWKTAIAASFGPLMTQLDAVLINLALPVISQDLNTTIATAQWLISGYLLALTLTLPLNAWLVNRFGAKRLFIAAFAAFTLASLLCATASNIETLIFARIIQGATGGLLAPMAHLMTARTAGRHLARIVGYIAIPILLAPIIGPTLAALILQWAGWPWLFYINLPVGVLAIVLALFLIPPDEEQPIRPSFDLSGFLLIAPGLAFALYGLGNVTRLSGVLLLLGGVGLLAKFIIHALRLRERSLIDVRLFSQRIFGNAAATQFAAYGAVFAGQMLFPLFLISGCKLPPHTAGWILAAQGVGMLMVYPLLGTITDRFGCRAVSMGGAILVICSTVPILWMAWTGGFSPILMVAALAIRGAGQSGIGLPSVSAAYASLPRPAIPAGATAINIVQRASGPVMVTIMAIIVSQTATPHLDLGPAAFRTALVALAVLHLIVLALASRLPIHIHPDREDEDAAGETVLTA